jgi:ABC-type transporter Mla maintaining outer membrane lipid asymmetry ATPase subunit MlaF
MLISIYTHEATDAYGRVIYVDPLAVVSHSPREGLDPDTMAKLEEELQELVEKRLAEAMKLGKERRSRQ